MYKNTCLLLSLLLVIYSIANALATWNSRFANEIVHNRDAKKIVQHEKNANREFTENRRRGRKRENNKQIRKESGFPRAFQLPRVRGCFPHPRELFSALVNSEREPAKVASLLINCVIFYNSPAPFPPPFPPIIALLSNHPFFSPALLATPSVTELDIPRECHGFRFIYPPRFCHDKESKRIYFRIAKLDSKN